MSSEPTTPSGKRDHDDAWEMETRRSRLHAYRADLEAKVRALPNREERRNYNGTPWPETVEKAAVLRLLTDGAEPPKGTTK